MFEEGLFDVAEGPDGTAVRRLASLIKAAIDER